MTITLSLERPVRFDDGSYTTGQEVTIFVDEASGTFGYRYHGVNFRGESYISKDYVGFESKGAATREALENYNIGTGC